MSSVYTPLLASARQATDGVLPTVSAPEDPDAPSEISWLQSFRSALLSSKVNLLLLFVPLGIVAGELGWSDAAIFSLNFLAIIPLASLLGLATEELALRVGQTIGGLLNATFGNAVELIVGIIALRANLLRVVQASLLGSVLSNLLLVLGFCFFFGGLRFKEQHFNQSAAMTSGSLLSISVLSLLIPAAFYAQLSSENDPRRDEKVLNLSRGTAVVLFAIYVSYLVFQLYTHTHLYQDSESNGRREPEPRVGTGPMLTVSDDRTGRALRKPTSADMNSTLRRRVSSPSFPAPSPSHPGSNIDEAGEEEEASMNTPSAAVLLLLSTIIVAVCAEYLVGSIEGLSKEWGLSEGFVGLILLPIVGNAAEHLTAVTVALKNKMELSLGVAVGSSLQISLMVAPLLVITGWIIGRPLTLEFTVFETAVSFVSVFIVNGLIADGSSNWLEGVMLLATYLVVAIAFYLY